MIGKKFNRLTVLEECIERDKHRRIVYKCLCDCGNITYVKGTQLRSGAIKSCGCIKGVSRRGYKYNYPRLYNTWQNMKRRCYDKKSQYYQDYGGRGITICDEWLNDNKTFFEWALNNGYQDDLTIDRIDVDGNYEPSNCRWATNDEQANNMRTNINLTYNGKTQSIAQWSRELGIKQNTLYARYHMGWSDIQCLGGKRLHNEMH